MGTIRRVQCSKLLCDAMPCRVTPCFTCFAVPCFTCRVTPCFTCDLLSHDLHPLDLSDDANNRDTPGAAPLMGFSCR